MLLSIFNTIRATTAFQAVAKFVTQTFALNTILALAAFYLTAFQLIEPTHIRNNNVFTASDDGHNLHSVLQKDTSVREGYLLMRQSDCYSCHADTKVMTAPSYIEIAEKYRKEKNVEPRLVNKVIEGGKGEWGNDRAMTPHPELLREDAHKMIAYILQLKMQNVK